MRRRPWIGLILVAGTLAAAAHFLLPRPRELLVIDNEALEFRLGARVRATGVPPSEPERREIEERLIQEELLLREAARRGLDRPAYVCRRLARKMRFLLSGDVPAPRTAELRRIYDGNPARYGGPAVPFKEAEASLRNEWQFVRMRALIERRIRELRRRYRVVLVEAPE